MTRRVLAIAALVASTSSLAACTATAIERDAADRPAPPPPPQPERENRPPASPTMLPPQPVPVPRVAVFGDSTALMTSFGLAQWLMTTGRGIYVDGRVDLGCGIVRQGIRRDQLGQGPNNPICQRWDVHWLDMLDRNQPDLVVVQIGSWDVIDHRLDGDAIWRAPGDPVYDAELVREMVAVVDLFASRQAHVAWLTLPRQRVEVGQAPGSESAPGTDPARARRYNELLAELPGQRPGAVTILDLAGWLSEPGRDEQIRPDGIHVTFETTHLQAEAWLGDAVISAFAAAYETGSATLHHG